MLMKCKTKMGLGIWVEKRGGIKDRANGLADDVKKEAGQWDRAKIRGGGSGRGM